MTSADRTPAAVSSAVAATSRVGPCAARARRIALLRPAAAAILAALLLIAPATAAATSDEASKPALRPAPAQTVVRASLAQWLDVRAADDATRKRVLAVWDAAPAPHDGPAMLERLVRALAAGDADARRIVERCDAPLVRGAVPSEPWLAARDLPAPAAGNLRLWYGRRLAQHALWEEAAEQLEGLRVEDVVDPATLLFYQGAVRHGLLKPPADDDPLRTLIEFGDSSPKRYVVLAKLMEAESRGLREDSLDHIARRMEDIERRLRLGRAGPKVRAVEDGVIKSLDKLIADLESQQQQQQQQQQASGEGSRQSGRPAAESTPMGGKGRGEVAKRNIGSESGWGNLPPKQRDEALQQIGREFPSHYRNVIEQYFRKLATEERE